MGDNIGNHHISTVAASLSAIGDNGMAVHQIVVNAVDLKVVGSRRRRQQ